jgi:predicted ArsR family transcriptional regulator
MQETRRYILEILKERGEGTVEDIVGELRKRRGDSITAVTVRHHLTRLQEDDLITTPQLRHRSAPGRPQHVYTLTEAAIQHLPGNYQPLAASLVEELREQLPPSQINVILEGVADRMVVEAHIPQMPLSERLKLVVDYLNQHGYNAQWESHDEGYILRTSNCPYHHIANGDMALCEMDMRLVAGLLGVVPRLMSRLSQGDTSCAYIIPHPAN